MVCRGRIYCTWHSPYTMEPDIDSELRFLPTPFASDAPIRRFPLEYYHDVWYRKTRMVWLRNSENILKICLFVKTEFMNVTDGWTDKRTYITWWHRLCLHSIMQQKSGCVARWAARERDKLTGKKTCKYYCIPSQYSNQFHAFYWKNWFVLEKNQLFHFVLPRCYI